MHNSRGSSPRANPDPSTAATSAGNGRKRHRILVGTLVGVLLAGLAVTLFDVFPSTPQDMVWIPTGEFPMGDSEGLFPDARPVHKVYVDGFWMDRTEVTNAQFARFVDATGYVTVAERPPDPREFPEVPAEKLVPGSIVFTPPDKDVSLDRPLSWWRWVPGANWRHPEGPGSTIEGKEQHPVVQICWHDAQAYAQWAGKRLPTEAEWEYAARGGLEQKRYCWGDDLLPGGKWQANIWQGDFPRVNTREDGFERTAPVGSYPANGFGLFDMAGNVWEWCADWYRPDYYAVSPAQNPRGPNSSYDPNEPDLPKRVQRGGSFLCSDVYCVRYRPGARGKGEPGSAASHIGFRCARSPK
ncbi:MAG TPA: formylglycine-generating enzyme family protein [Gemmataceae bacterium]|nr:formylglycine-generating enzyme family protein [Gemmataceae bacterium]